MEKRLSPPDKINRIRSSLKNFIVIILSAGKGQRFGQITKNIPKSLIKLERLNSVPILEHLIMSFFELGVKKICIIRGHLGIKIVHFIENLISERNYLKEIIKVIDSGTLYKKGALYSFSSIFNYLNSFHEEDKFIVVPGDTIFETRLLHHIKGILMENLELLRNYPLIFYKECSFDDHDINPSQKSISIVKGEKKKSLEYLKTIESITTRELKIKDKVKQIIPLFIFNYPCMRKIQKTCKEFEGNTLREIINFFINQEKEKFLLRRVDSSLRFHDIDTIEDLKQFEGIS